MQKKGRIALIAALAYAVASILLVAVFYRGPEAFQAADTGAVEEVAPEKEAVEQAVPGDPEASFVDQYRLPALERMSAGKAEELVDGMQVMRKIAQLGLTEQDWLYPERELGKLDATLAALAVEGGARVTFDGTTASALNAFLGGHAGATVVIESPEIDVDETIELPSGMVIEGGGARLAARSEIAAIRLNHVQNVAVRGLNVEPGFSYGVYAMGCDGVVIEDCDIRGATRKPVAVMGDCDGVVVRGNRVTDNDRGGLYFNGDIANALIEANDIENNRGVSNWMAGIVLTGIDVADEADVFAPFDENEHFPTEQRLDTMLKAPHNVIVRKNCVTRNTSTGVYCDGPYRVYVVENRVEDNDKEGLCLDYGTVGAYVSGNDIVGNGNRGRQSDRDLEKDYVLDWGRLEDGSACAKLPGLSIDNAAYNIVYNNNISGNYGSGVKMVRSGVRNIISTNLITGNNRGASDKFHFFGIELGCAAEDDSVINLDYRPEYENIVCRNIITGTHYAGVFLSEEAYINDIFDNTVMDATHWAIECLSERNNSFVNNYSPLESRGL